MIEASSDRTSAIIAAWNTGKIVHRQAAMRLISRHAPERQPLPVGLESIVLGGAFDVDLNVRESAFAILRSHQHPALAALAAAQLQDCDPQTRLLGLNYLKHVNPNIGVPTIIPLLDEDDPLICVAGLKCLENWTGQKFGVKLADTAPSENEKSGLIEYPAGSRDKAIAGAQAAKSWWATQQSQFPPVHLEVPPAAVAAQKPRPVGDFSLRALDGRRVSLAALRGKVVLINFWTTWCTACVSEMSALIALQKRHGDQLAIIGISLDFTPDSHGHIGGHAAVEEQKQTGGDHDEHERNEAALKKVREKVIRTAKARGVNYTILLDEENEIGGRFNGGELPTTVIVDAQGNVRRRFIGARSLPVFEAMITEAGQSVVK